MGRTSDAKQRLMTAAHDLIWEYSYSAVTVDAICDRAKVKKGSFYYFFASKSELASVAIEAWWNERDAAMREMFRKTVPPLERIRSYLDYVAESQLEEYKTSGHIRGCPLHSMAAEIVTQDDVLHSQLNGMLTGLRNYVESAIRDAQARGEIPGTDAEAKAKTLLAFYVGALVQARISNDPELVRTMSHYGLELLGARPAPPIPTLEEIRPSLATLS